MVHCTYVPLLAVAVALLIRSAAGAQTTRPNFVIVLTDDQDVLLGGMDAMPNTLRLLRDGGRTYDHAYVSTPICCPSRVSTLSGRYGHNTGGKEVQNWCGAFTGHAAENQTWVTALHASGYVTQMSGKYHNAPPQHFVPAGWSDFFSLVNECEYFNNTFTDNGVNRVVHGYMTSSIGNRSLAFLRNALAGTAPFLAYIAPHAAHMPTTPAPWYADTPLANYGAPRTPQYNASGVDKHWVLAEQAPLSREMEIGIDSIAAMRTRALLSVDDIVHDVEALLIEHGVANNTYWIYTSDHGYSLGTFRMPVEKFHLYEPNVRVPFYVAGPGVIPNSTSSALVSNVDIGATILDIAGVAAIPTDGRSFAADLTGRSNVEQQGVRDRLLIEYGFWGTGYIVRGPCPRDCGECTEAELSTLVDAPSNTFSALRIANSSHDIVYAEFRGNSIVNWTRSSTNWTEAYDLRNDPWQLTNIALQNGSARLIAQLSKELWQIANCSGAACP